MPSLQPDSENRGSTPNTAYPRFTPGSSSWVVEVMFRPGIPGTTKRERPVYWHGPDKGCRASAPLNSDVAVFDSETQAISTFKSAALPIPPTASSWRALSTEEALAHGEKLPARYSWGGGYFASPEP